MSNLIQALGCNSQNLDTKEIRKYPINAISVGNRPNSCNNKNAKDLKNGEKGLKIK